MIELSTIASIRIVSVGASLENEPFDACLADDIERLCAHLGLADPPRQAPQVHGKRIDRLGDGLSCDAFFVQKGQAALIRHADCMPFVVFDAVKDHAVVAHCGWRGIQLRLPVECVELLLAEGSCPENLRMVCGPCIGPASFEVSREFQDGFPASTWSTTSWGTPAVDLIQVVTEQMRDLGLSTDSWTPCGIDTFTQLDWHSHRRFATTARNATLCWIPAATPRTRTIQNLLLP